MEILILATFSLYKWYTFMVFLTHAIHYGIFLCASTCNQKPIQPEIHWDYPSRSNLWWKQKHKDFVRCGKSSAVWMTSKHFIPLFCDLSHTEGEILTILSKWDFCYCLEWSLDFTWSVPNSHSWTQKFSGLNTFYIQTKIIILYTLHSNCIGFRTALIFPLLALVGLA